MPTPQELMKTFIEEARAAGYTYEGLCHDEMMFSPIRGATALDHDALVRAGNKFTAGMMQLLGLVEETKEANGGR